MIDRIRSTRFINLGNGGKRDPSSLRKRQRQPSYSLNVRSGFIIQSHDQIKRSLSIQDSRDNATIHRRLDKFIDSTRGQTIKSQLFPVQFQPKLGNQLL